jgi:hypothetical protein
MTKTISKPEAPKEPRKEEKLSSSAPSSELSLSNEEEVLTPSNPPPIAPQIAEKKRGRKKKYETEEEAHKVAQEQRKNYRERQKDKIEQKRLLRSMLDSIPSLKKRLLDANTAIYTLMKGTEPIEFLYELPDDVYEDAYALLHPIKKKMCSKPEEGQESKGEEAVLQQLAKPAVEEKGRPE